MKELSLNGKWKMRGSALSDWIDAAVPGSVYADLLVANKMDDPFYADNENSAMQMMEQDFTYCRKFSVNSELLQANVVRLVCKGLDTVADIYINQKHIAHTDNMHRTWEIDVSDKLKLGENDIEIVFSSPLVHIRAEYKKMPAEGSEECMVGFPTLRKAHCQFGWDWGPHLPDAGIWRDISLVAINKACIKSVLIQQHHRNNEVMLLLEPDIEKTCLSEYSIKVVVTAPNGKKIMAEGLSVLILNPQLWWPNGLGEQPLYTVEVNVLDKNSHVLDTWTRRIGLRTMTVNRKPDEWGESFAHCVNGVEFFAMGADYIPEDSIFGRRSIERTRRLLQDCALANYNVIRVWGGGCYPDDWFFDICDELGIVIWQDFMFACAVYNLTEKFEENIMAELSDNITRIRHHASIGLFCGNNEMEMFVDQGRWVLNHRQKADYIKMYEYLFPKLTQKLAPQIYYWPASPSSGGSFDDPNAPDRGDVHFWEVWHGNKPFDEYQKHYFRYLSEFGFESFPCKKTIDSFAAPEQQNIFSYVMEKHQKKSGANGKIVTYLAQTYLYPQSFDLLIYASQLLQAEAVAYGVEHLRRHRGRCMGTVYWQINDCWPVASWASIDYFGRWKALHYYAKRFFAPILLSAQIKSALTENPNINQEKLANEKLVRINLSNETKKHFTGKITWEIRCANGKIEKQNSVDINIKPFTAQWPVTIDASEYSLFNHYVFYKLIALSGKVVSERTAFFCQPKYFAFPNPQITAKVDSGEVVVYANAFAKAVCIDSADTELLMEDNYFDMQKGEKHIKILRGTPKNLTVHSVYDIK